MSYAKKHVLKLYVVNVTPRIEVIISNLCQICDRELGEKYDLQIINILDDPEQAENDSVLATPTLIKKLPFPAKRVIGDISSMEKVMAVLDLKEAALKI